MAAIRPLSIARAALAAIVAVAGVDRAAADHEAQAAILAPLFVNGTAAGEALVHRDGADFLVRESDLAGAGIRTDRLRGRVVHLGGEDGEGHVSLASLAPAMRFAFDEVEAVLRLEVRPDLLPRREIDVASRHRPARLQRGQDAALFLNYAVRGRELADPFARDYALAGEIGASAGGVFAYSAASTDPDGRPVRGLSWIGFDLPDRLARLTAGDSFASSTRLGGGAFVGGLQLARRFEMDPWLQRTPMPSLSGAAESPSTLEIYVDDVLVRRERIDPGVFEIRNLPVTAGSGTTSYVLRDAFGRETRISGTYSVGASLLRAGLTDYAYTAGFRRERLGFESAAYGDPVFLGAHRVGITDWLTGGARLEAAPDLVSGGGTVALAAPVGLLTLEGAASRADGRPGSAGAISWVYASRALGLSLWAEGQSGRYAHMGLAPAEDRPLLDAGAGVSVPLGAIGSATMRASHRRMRDGGIANVQGVGATWRLAPGLTLSTTGTHAVGDAGSSWEAYAALALVLPGSATAQIWARSDGARDVGGFAVQENPLGDTGWEYRAASTQGDLQTIEMRAGYRGTMGQARTELFAADGRASVGAEVAGSIVAIGDRVFLSRPIDRSFALVRVPGVPHASVRLNNREVGRTDADGELFVPGLLSYDANRISVDPTDLPLDRSFRSLEVFVAPPRGGGVVATLEVEAVRVVRGRVVRFSRVGRRTPIAYGEIVVRTPHGPETFLIGSQGQFEVDLPPGVYSASVRDDGGTCTFELVVPADRGAISEVGTLLCLEDPHA